MDDYVFNRGKETQDIRYWFFRFPENFFDNDAILETETLINNTGYIYIVILLKLYCLTVRDGGTFTIPATLDGSIDYLNIGHRIRFNDTNTLTVNRYLRLSYLLPLLLDYVDNTMLTPEEIKMQNGIDEYGNPIRMIPVMAVSIEVTEERKLKKKIGVPLDTEDSQSMLILGVAVNKRKKYSIILENGAPRISLIATFAHELTHIWQYTHWDNNKNMRKCSRSKRMLIYEGMAKWVEIQYLYLIGEKNVAKREELITRNREDEYGIGFRLYEDRYPLTVKPWFAMKLHSHKIAIRLIRF